ncbi:MAG: hypothetical protein NZ879_00095 [Archaeoglobaceae archaeon]|nr:hypothetical protein [Archaeoglobaceae archaeon]MDW8117371.1 hypothetical protein [Archaeoglobaceae archaeon]
MISSIASIILAVALGIKLPLIAPVIYLLRFWRRDIFLVGFLFYSLALCYEFTVVDIYSIQLYALSLLIATFLLLEEGINVRRKNFTDYFLATSMISGFILIEILFPLLIVSSLYMFYYDKPKKGILALGFIAFLSLIFIFFRQELSYIGSSATQAILISALTAIACLFWLRRI